MNPRIKNVQQIATAGVLFLASVVVLSGTAGAAAPECDGQPATIVGTSGPDRLYGTAADDVVWLGGEDVSGGTDVFVDTLGGDDLICQGGEGDANIQAGPDDDNIHLVGRATVYGGAGADRIEGGEIGVKLFGGSGNDVLIGTAGFDQLVGESGADSISGGAGSDQIDGGQDDDQIDAGAGDDLVIGGPGSDTVDAGEGADRLAYSTWRGKSIVTQMESGVAMDLSAGTVTSDTGTTHASGVECWTATPYADTIDGTSGPDCINGADGGGADTIRALAGNDEVWVYYGSVDGGAGNDELSAQHQRFGEPTDKADTVVIRGGEDDDLIRLRGRHVRAIGGAGSDWFYMFQSRDATARGGTGRNKLNFFFRGELDARTGTASFARPGHDLSLRFDHIQVFAGSPRSDVIRGSGADEKFSPGEGNDLIRGRGGDDRMIGSSGDDDLNGGAGRDLADGGPGNDRCNAEIERGC